MLRLVWARVVACVCNCCALCVLVRLRLCLIVNLCVSVFAWLRACEQRWEGCEGRCVCVVVWLWGVVCVWCGLSMHIVADM